MHAPSGWGPGGAAGSTAPPAAGSEAMTIVDNTKFVIGIIFAVLGIAVLVSARATRGFGQRKQAGALLLVGAAAFVAVGVGLLDL